MTPIRSVHALNSVKTLLHRSALVFGAVQAAVISGLVLMGAVRRRLRKRRSGFPNPGVYECAAGSSTLTVYTYGEDLYRDMLEAIHTAKHSILLESFIWKGDATGQQFKDALSDAAARGVQVRVMYDGFANLVVRPSFYNFPRGIHTFRFPVLRPSFLFMTIPSTGLDHRKLLIVDDETGFVGGYNIGSLYATKWRDTHLKITGPSVWELRQAFVSVWNERTGTRLPKIPEKSPGFWEPRIRALNNIPSQLVYPIRGMYLDAINRAEKHIFITMAYFIPDRQILDALLRASRRGVDVRVIVPECSNHVLYDWLSRGFYTSLLENDVTVLLYQPAMIHAKTATVDGEWTTIGTANIDRLSLTGNYEVNLEIHNPDFARSMEEIFEIDSANSRMLTLGAWQRRHIVARFSEAVLAPWRPLL